MSFTRREFIGTTAAGAVAAGSLIADPGTTVLPTRVLGKTGVRVSILAMGAGSRYLSYKEEDEALAAAQKCIDGGITYIDTADDYGKDHLSEQRIGKAITGRREGLFIATKISTRDPEEAKRQVELSLKSLGVDRVDLLHIHSLLDEDDLAKVEAKGGVLDQLHKFRDQKMTRFIGVTSHTNPAVMGTALERHDFDCCQMALNAGMASMINGGKGRGMVPNDAMKGSFETAALPVAVRKKMGVLAIKSFAQDALIGQAPVEKLLYYTLSLPVTAAVVGMPNLEHIDHNLALAKAFKRMPQAEMHELSQRLTSKNKQALERFFHGHVDC
jgi:aryl-alcohol dehydrogenase-like predicted oxidoreductase